MDKKYTTDHLDDAVLAGYNFQAVIDALNASLYATAGTALATILDAAKSDNVGDFDND